MAKFIRWKLVIAKLESQTSVWCRLKSIKNNQINSIQRINSENVFAFSSSPFRSVDSFSFFFYELFSKNHVHRYQNYIIMVLFYVWGWNERAIFFYSRTRLFAFNRNAKWMFALFIVPFSLQFSDCNYFRMI